MLSLCFSQILLLGYLCFHYFEIWGFLSLSLGLIGAVRDGLASRGSCLRLMWERWESSFWAANGAVPHFSREETRSWLSLEGTARL